jgi:ferredoxin
MEIIVDEGKCVGGGRCVVTAPDVFDQRESDGIVILLDATPPESQHPNVREAEVLCPAAAIRLQEKS